MTLTLGQAQTTTGASLTATPRFEAIARRDGRFWYLQVIDRPELKTQAVRLEQAEAMVRDLIATWDEVDPASFDVLVLPRLEPDLSELVREAQRDRNAAEAAVRRASASTRAAARAITAAGLTVRDAGVVLGMSHQRVSQLLVED